MLIDQACEIHQETVIPVTSVPDYVPRREGGEKIGVSTANRWASRGVGGVVLNSFKCGGRRMTSLESIDRFLKRLSERDNVSI